MITLGLSGWLRAGDLRSIRRSVPQASPADVSRHKDQVEAQTFRDKHHCPSARLPPALIWSDSCWAPRRTVARMDDVFFTSVTWRQVRPAWRWWWMSVNFLSSSSLPTQLAALLTASCFASARRVLSLTRQRMTPLLSFIRSSWDEGARGFNCDGLGSNGLSFCLSPFKPSTQHKAFFRLLDVTCSFQLRSGRVQGC